VKSSLSVEIQSLPVCFILSEAKVRTILNLMDNSFEKIIFLLSVIYLTKCANINFEANNWIEAGEDYVVNCSYSLSEGELLDYLQISKDNDPFYSYSNYSRKFI